MTTGAVRDTTKRAERETYVVTLVELPGPVTGISRVKRLLKALLRVYGLKCVGIRRDRR